MITIKKGLNLPLSGSPKQQISQASAVTSVAVLGQDFLGMKPSMLVVEGQEVKVGSPLFSCKKNEGVLFTSPAAGRVKQIKRGDKRVFQSVVIEVSHGQESQHEFKKYQANASLTSNYVKDLLVESGLWTSLRTRPFSKTPSLQSEPSAIFVNTMDTHPHALDSQLLFLEYEEDLKNGVEALSHLTKNKLYVTYKDGTKVPKIALPNVEYRSFSGVHPAGNVGTHIHFLHPVSAHKSVWHMNYQDVIAVGKLFKTGKLWTDRYVSLAGPLVKNPRVLKTRLGANALEITKGELAMELDQARLISGSVLNGVKLEIDQPYLGRFSQQVSVIEEGRSREFLGWHSPGINKFSIKNIYLSRLFPKKLFSFNTSTNGSERAIVPTGNFEKVMPLDILATPLLRYLVVKETEQAQALGCLELDEEDLSLCTYVCSGKNDYGVHLRNCLNLIEKEG
jgi:Na+-transporting NADH:ubiquinone oxidoreductase subunit A